MAVHPMPKIFDLGSDQGLGSSVPVLDLDMSCTGGPAAAAGPGRGGIGADEVHLSWASSSGLMVQIDPSMAAFISEVGCYENCSVEVCLAGGFSLDSQVDCAKACVLIRNEHSLPL